VDNQDQLETSDKQLPTNILEAKMGYYIKYLPFKKSNPMWKVQFVSHKKIDIVKSNPRSEFSPA
jgi:hypothetical protein